MSPIRIDTPELLPVLSRGRHRSARRGACFMEYASVLAGERWSDHPQCTHPALASLARLVNDCSSDEARNKLAPLIPSVIGLLGDERTSLVVAIGAATAALPVVSEHRQRALAAGLLRCAELLDEDDGPLGDGIRSALASVPGATEWARSFIATVGPVNPRVVSHMCDAVIRTSVIGVAEACVQNPNERMFDMLVSAIATCTPAPVVVVNERQAKERQPIS